MMEVYINDQVNDDKKYSVERGFLEREIGDIFNHYDVYTIASFDNLEDAKKCFEKWRDDPWETYQSEGYPDDRGYSVSLTDNDEGCGIDYEEYTADDYKLDCAGAEEEEEED